MVCASDDVSEMTNEPLDDRLADRLLTGRPLPAHREDLTDLAVFVAAMRSGIDRPPTPAPALAQILDEGVAAPTAAEVAASAAAARPVLTGLEVTVAMGRSALRRAPGIVAARARLLASATVRYGRLRLAIARWWTRSLVSHTRERTASFSVVGRRAGRVLKVAVANVAALSLIAQAGLAGGAVATATVLAGVAGVLPVPVHERVANVVSLMTPFELPNRAESLEAAPSSDGDLGEALLDSDSSAIDELSEERIIESESSDGGPSTPSTRGSGPGGLPLGPLDLDEVLGRVPATVPPADEPAVVPPAAAASPQGALESAPGQSGSAPGQSGSAPGQSGSAPGQSGGSGQSGSAPGQSGSAPGQSGSAPGQSGSAPGQSGSAPGQSGSAPGQSGSAPGQSGGSGQSGSAPGQSSGSGNAGGTDDAPGNSGSAPRGGAGRGGGGGGGSH